MTGGDWCQPVMRGLKAEDVREKGPKKRVLELRNSSLELVFGEFSFPMTLVVEPGEKGLQKK